MKTIDKSIKIQELRELAKKGFGDLVKAVVDVKSKSMVIDVEMHADAEAELLRNGSKQDDLWGINLYLELYPDSGWIEFNSMINLRPSQGNRTRGVEDAHLREAIVQIVNELVIK